MSASSPAPESEPGELNHGSDETTTTPAHNHSHDSAHAPHTLDDGNNQYDDPAVTIPIKSEHDSHNNTTNTTATTLRPSPQPSIKRRESLAADTDTPELSDRPGKKRKRAVSPPWQFPTVDTATVKTADGRRVSARVNTGTPVLSESEGRARSVSQSQSASRSRPPSPPWKKFGAEGPTSIQVDGVRKSGRVNKELSEPPKPKRTSPRQKKLADKLAAEGKSDARPMSRGGKVVISDGATESASKKTVKVERAQSPSAKIAELQAQIAALKPSRSFGSPEPEVKPSKSDHKRKRSSVAHEEASTRPSSPTANRKSHRHTNAALSPDVTRPSPRIKLRFSGSARHIIPDPHPQARVSPPARPPSLSLHQVIEKYELIEMQQPYMENEHGPPDAAEFRRRHEKQAQAEGEMRRKLLKAAEPGGALSKDNMDLFGMEQQDEPPPQYGHNDHLVNHALYLRQLQLREKTNHRLLAKKVAYEAFDFWKAMRGPTEEDLRAEEDKIFRLIYKQVVFDMRGKWEMVANHVQQLKREKWEAEEAVRRQEKLQRQLEQAEAMVAKQRGEDESDMDLDEDSTGDVAGSETEDEDEEQGSEAENMSESAEESEAGGEMDEDALAAYLAQREAEPPDKAEDEQEDDEDGEEQSPEDGDEEGLSHTAKLLAENEEGGDAEEQEDYQPDAEDPEEAEPADTVTSSLGKDGNHTSRAGRSQSAEPTAEEQAVEADLSEDESVDMDSEDYDSDEDMSSTGDEAEAGSQDEGDQSSVNEEEDVELSTLGFFLDKKDIKAIGLPTPTTSAEGDERDRTAEVVSDDNIDPQAEAGAVSVERKIKEEVTEIAQGDVSTAVKDHAEPVTPLPVDSVDPDTASRGQSVDPRSETGVRALVPTPVLLRGQLRSYQHAGLDWLASLYRNGTNGILADEMGLGKTIQTIALLAHLAEERGVWEPHLVIVPTSVILNWVAEFHKFLPGFRVLGYYGSADERAAKRRGWVNDPHHEDRSKRGYNVVVTSYNVAMQDINAIRNVQWHYLVLDEAHNIRNFNSQRWQVLIRLKTKARLLLTGTPLQNSLTELWSLLTFLTAGDDEPQHGRLEEFLSHWKEPVKEIFDRGVSTLSAEAQKVVDQLHVSLRPFLLRRLKSEVEKDLPKKTEKVVVCKLSKRQRQLYQEYMGLASTKESLTKGNAVSAGRVLLSLRRVCNHPDLFDPRPIQTSFAMEKSPLEPYAVKEMLVRRLLGTEAELPAGLLVVGLEGRRRYATKRSRQLVATAALKKQVGELETASQEMPDVGTPAGCFALQRLRKRERKLQHLRDSIQITEAATKDAPVYGCDLRELVTVHSGRPYTFTQRARMPQQVVRSKRAWPALGHRPLQVDHLADWLVSKTTTLQQDILSLDRYAENLHDIVERFAFSPPVVTAPILDHAIPPHMQNLLRASPAYPTTSDYAHEARIRTSIAFPDSRLLMYDSGKLQRLKDLLRDLQSRGSRSLIFTQMTGTLNILEQFLSLLNLPYLRLDGSTPVERRQLYAAEFNRPDSKYQAMILSSRAGGVGLNLVGASSVIFYDLDWNPQMDRQCMDRAHRIGQVRDVEVYKMVSEKTVEENILRRANQKSLLDQTVIQAGHFTTEYPLPSRASAKEGQEGSGDEVAAAIERFLGGGEKATTQAIESVEDREDVAAARQARKEEHLDDVDFAERSSKGPSAAATPAPGVPGVGVEGDGGEEDGGDGEGERKGHVDGFMVRWMQEMTRDRPFVPPQVRRLDKHGRDPSHRPKRKR